MIQGFLEKVAPDHYIPHGDDLDAVRIGEFVSCKTARKRNVMFHRKYFALLRVAYDAWEPQVSADDFEKYGIFGTPVKNFDRFRKDIIIATGHYDLVVNLKGEVRAEAKSISFGNMSEEQFEELYSRTIDYLLQKIMINYTREDIDMVVNEIIGFT